MKAFVVTAPGEWSVAEVEAPAAKPGSVSVDVRSASQRELFELLAITGDDGGEVHHFADPERVIARQDPLHVLRGQRGARGLEGARRHA